MTDEPIGAVDLSALRPADVILVRYAADGTAARLRQWANIFGQRALAAARLEEAVPVFATDLPDVSHVILGLGPGAVIHADGRGVPLATLTDALHLEDAPLAFFEVHRHAGLDAETAARVAAEARRWQGQAYDFLGGYVRAATVDETTDRTQFCSRLIAHAFRAAGRPISGLPDNRLLPRDLLRACRSAPWVNVTAEFLPHEIPPSLDAHLGEMDLPGHGKISLSEFLRRSDELTKKVAEQHVVYTAERRDHLRNALRAEALLCQFAAAKLALAREMRISPAEIAEVGAEDLETAMRDAEGLMTLAALPSLGQPTEQVAAYADPLLGGGRSLYVDFPAPDVVAKMRRDTLALRLLAAPLLLETAVFVTVAHVMDDVPDDIAHFRAAPAGIADRLFAALAETPPFDPPPCPDDGYAWVTGADDRAHCVRMHRNVALGLDVLRRLMARGAAAGRCADPD